MLLLLLLLLPLLFLFSCCLQWDEGAIQAAKDELLQQLADPSRTMIGPQQLQDVAEAVQESGGWVGCATPGGGWWAAAAKGLALIAFTGCRQAGRQACVHDQSASRPPSSCFQLCLTPLPPSPCCATVGAARPWQFLVSQTVLSQIKAPKLMATVRLQPRLLAWICRWARLLRRLCHLAAAARMRAPADTLRCIPAL